MSLLNIETRFVCQKVWKRFHDTCSYLGLYYACTNKFVYTLHCIKNKNTANEMQYSLSHILLVNRIVRADGRTRLRTQPTSVAFWHRKHLVIIKICWEHFDPVRAGAFAEKWICIPIHASTHQSLQKIVFLWLGVSKILTMQNSPFIYFTVEREFNFCKSTS